MPTVTTPTCPTAVPDLFARVESSFVFPDEGESVEVVIKNVKLTEQQVLTSEKYGTLTVFSILDHDNGVYDLINNGESENTDLVGKRVPCGTDYFPAGGGSVIASSTNCTELTKDFRIPEVGLTAVAEVSSLAGFEPNGAAIIRLKSNSSIAYRYVVVSTSGTNSITLRNDGQGGAAGTWLTADADCDAVNDWCVEGLEDGSICDRAVESNGLPYILGCDGSSVVKLTGTTDKQVPAWDAEQEKYTNFLIPDLQSCVDLAACFQVAPWAGCAPIPVYITTSDDQLLIDRATEALLSSNADPIVTICGDDFRLILGSSVVGSIVVIPTFNPVDVVSYDENCQVCVPVSCCDQCNPQVEPPVEDYTFTGKFVGGSLALPTDIFGIVGEYKFKIVVRPDTQELVTVQYDSATNALIQVYDIAGNVVVPAGDPTLFSLDDVSYCNDGPCPLLLTHGLDTTLDMEGNTADMYNSFNYHSFVASYPCDAVGVSGSEIQQTQHQIIMPYNGETVLSTTSLGPDENWGVPAPAGISKSFQAVSGESERSISIFPGQCFYAAAELTMLTRVNVAPAPGGFVIIKFNSNIRVLSELI